MALAHAIEGEHGTPVVFVMGLGMRGRLWRPQVDGLARRHRCLTFDHRGIGESPDVPGDFTLADLAADAVDLVDAKDLGPAHLVGVSMGGMIAQEMALTWPERWLGLSLIATSPGGRGHWLPPVRGLRRVFALQRAQDETDRMARLDRLLFPDGFMESVEPKRRAQRHADVGRAAEPTVVQRQLRAVRRHDARERLRSLRLKTLVMQPGADRLVSPRHSEHIAQLIPDSRLVHVGGAGHGLIFQCAEHVNRALLDHFQRCEA